ncbi:MAG: hypothetical protein M3373_12630 [Gemmatimonadota bacterium]|nr:hypothetical protein [Gemmatimonadota bacterium]
MLRTIFAVGAMTLAGLFVLRLIFGIFGGLFGLLFALLGLAIKIAIVGLVVYFILKLVSPDTARRIRERWSGPSA